MKYDPSIALGTLIHLGALVSMLALMYWMASRRLARIEKKQDRLLESMKK